jgi:hypothetical protein
MDTALSLFFMVFALGFFLFAMRVITRDHRESWERRLMEAREFGLRKPRQTETQPSEKK